MVYPQFVILSKADVELEAIMGWDWIVSGQSIAGILVKISLNFSRSTMGNYFLFPVLISKHKIERQNFSFLSRKMRFSFKFLNKSRCIILRKIKKLKVFFWKISVQAQATNQILVNSRENCLNLDSRSRLEV